MGEGSYCMDEFPKKINLFKLEFDEGIIYKYSGIPITADEKDFNKRRSDFFSFKKYEGYEEVPFNPYNIHKIVTNKFKDKLLNNSYELEGKYKAYKKSSETDYGTFKFFDGFEYRFVPLENELFLALDYKLVIKTSVSIQELLNLDIPSNLLIGNSVELKGLMNDNKGKLLSMDNNNCLVDFYSDGLKSVDATEIYPLCRPEVLRVINRKLGNRNDVIRLQRQKSLINPRKRLLKIEEIIKSLNDERIFPLKIEDVNVDLCKNPLSIEEIGYSPEFGEDNCWDTFYDGSTLKCDEQLEEPYLEFDGSSYIKPYPTSYPPYLEVEDLSLILYCPSKYKSKAEILVAGLKRYLMNFFNAEKVDIPICFIDHDPVNDQYVEEIRNLFKFKTEKIDLAIIYVPEEMKYKYNSSYYSLKLYFASSGIPTQMITEKTFNSPFGSLNYTWLNICIAILAKCGGIPWVLKKKLQETDMIIGISFSASLRNIGENIHKNRYVGFANVFNRYGKWCYFCGTANKYDKDNELNQIKEMLTNIKNHYSSNQYFLPKNIIIHTSKRMNRKLQNNVYSIMKTLFGNDCNCAFITIDESHIYRCFDSNSSDGSLARGFFVYLNNKEILLSTTGKSRLGGKKMGTPVVLHIMTDQYPKKFLNLENIANQVLALTKLNWASVMPVQREPVTIKYANRLAKIAANVGSDKFNNISDILFNKPWFI